MIHTLTLFLGFCLLQYAIRGCGLAELSFLNEDAALILRGTQSLHEDGMFHWLTHSYGPSIIRPWQLLAMGGIGTFSHDPLTFYLFQILLLATGQTLLYFALRPIFTPAAAAIAAGCIGLSRAGAESLYWLSSMHDLFLLAFGALTLIAFRKWMTLERVQHSSLWAIIAICSLWATFLSNEKAVAFPVVIACYLLSLPRSEPFYRKILGYLSPWILLVVYFAYRYSLLDSLIGGYTDKPFADNFFTPSALGSWLFSTCTSLFWQPEGKPFFLWLGVSGVAILASGTWLRQQRTLWYGALLWLVAHIAFSLPTAQFALPFNHHDVFSTRMYWPAVLTFSVGIGALVHVLTLRKQWIVTSLGVLLCALSLLSGSTSATRQFTIASKFTDQSLMEFRAQCSCSSPQHPQSNGLPQHAGTVNIATEDAWLDYHAELRGLSRCTADQARCQLNFMVRDQRPLGIPAKTTRWEQVPLTKNTVPVDDCVSLNKRRHQWIISRASNEAACQSLSEFVIFINEKRFIRVTPQFNNKARFRITLDQFSPSTHQAAIWGSNGQTLVLLTSFAFVGTQESGAG